MTKTELFIKLAQPDENGYSRWVEKSEFVGEYAPLMFQNGCDFARRNSTLAKKYIVVLKKDTTPGPSVDAIKLDGYNKKESFNQSIRADIRKKLKTEKCVMLGINGTSENTKIEIDHKDGRKDDWRVSNVSTQKEEDFQPLCKAANDIKRQICKQCKETNLRWDAKNIKGNPYSFYEGNEKYTDSLGCVGCYQYDPVEYRKTCAKMISEEASKITSDFIMNKLYPEGK
jgi:hypothetical protein